MWVCIYARVVVNINIYFPIYSPITSINNLYLQYFVPNKQINNEVASLRELSLWTCRSSLVEDGDLLSVIKSLPIPEYVQEILLLET